MKLDRFIKRPVLSTVISILIVILGILWIPIMRSVGDVLYTYLQDVQSVLAPGIAAAFLLASAGNVLLRKEVCGD